MKAPYALASIFALLALVLIFTDGFGKIDDSTEIALACAVVSILLTLWGKRREERHAR